MNNNRRSNVVTAKSVPPKTTLMNKRETKKPNMTGKQPMMYPTGVHK